MFKRELEQEAPPSIDRGSFIEEGLKFTGNSVSTGNLTVEGEIEGDVQCASLTVGEKGRVTGAVIAEDVVIAGQLKGSISGLRVTLKPGCHVDGDVCYQSLEIEHGAHFEGQSKRSDNPISPPSSNTTEPESKMPMNEPSIGKLMRLSSLGAIEQGK